MKQTTLVWLAVIVLALFLAAGLAKTAFAQWSNDPTLNTPVAVQLHIQDSPQLCYDGAGGTIITWEDYRSGVSMDIYAQRLNAAGVPQWTTNGVVICAAVSAQPYQLDPQIICDGSGGAIITWQDNRTGTSWDIYAQRVNSMGTVQWTPNGVAICVATSDQYQPRLATDGSGGAIITWHDYRAGAYPDVYAQRINSSGILQWTTNGVAVCTGPYWQAGEKIISDGSGGAIITWEEGIDVYAQRVNSLGAKQWTTNGVPICVAEGTQTYLELISDGSNGAIITWQDYRSGSSYDIYAQRVSSSGALQWLTNGVAICIETNHQEYPQLAIDGSGGALITWQDCRGSLFVYDIYAQHVNASGVTQWATSGQAICSASNSQQSPQLISDSSGGAIITWADYRSGSGSHIYAQRVNSSGVAQWTTDGVAISTASDYPYSQPRLAGDGSGGAVITWHDYRGGSGTDVYAQNVNRNGQLGLSSPSIIADGGFEQGTANWTMYSATPNGINFSTVAGGPSGSYAKVHINATSNNMQVYQTYFPLTAGKRYTLGFDAYSPTSRRVFATVHKHNAPYGSYGFGEWIQLGPNWTHYERQFTATGFSGTTSDTRLRFYFVYACASGDDYFFDNVSLVQALAKGGEEQDAGQPSTFLLEQNYPNPFNPTTNIRFQIPNDGHVSLKVFDVLGREVTTLVNDVLVAGTHDQVFDASAFASGLYFYRLQAEGFTDVKKLVVLK